MHPHSASSAAILAEAIERPAVRLISAASELEAAVVVKAVPAGQGSGTFKSR
jgi:hypothetical protein